MARVTDDLTIEAWHEAIAHMFSEFSPEARKNLLDFCLINDYDPISGEAYLLLGDDGREVVYDSTRAVQGDLIRKLDACGARIWQHTAPYLARAHEREAHGVTGEDVLVIVILADDEVRRRHMEDTDFYIKQGWTVQQVEQQIGPIPGYTLTTGYGIWRKQERDSYCSIRNWSPVKSATNRAFRNAVATRAGNTRSLHNAMHDRPAADPATIKAIFGTNEPVTEKKQFIVDAMTPEQRRHALGRSSPDDSLID